MKKIVITILLLIALNAFCDTATKKFGSVRVDKFSLKDATELTVASGVIAPTQSYHYVDTESDAATDDIDTITYNGFNIIYFKQANSSRKLVFKNGTGNIVAADDYTLQDNVTVSFLYDSGSSKWSIAGGGGGSSTYTANRAIVSDSLGALSVSTTTDTEIGYLNGVTSSIQTQLNAKSYADKTETFTNKTIDADSNTISNIDNGEIKAAAAIEQTKIALRTLGTPTYDNLDDLVATMSASIISGFTVTDGGGDTVDVAAGTAIIKNSDSDIAPLVSIDYAGTTGLAVTPDTLVFIYLDYNSGTPITAMTADVTTLDLTTQIPIATVYSGTDMHISDIPANFNNISMKQAYRLFETYGYRRTGGMVTTETGTRNLAITAGVYYYAHWRIPTTAKNTSTGDNFQLWYNDGSWQQSTATQIPNTQYNNYGVGLANLSNNQYGVFWVYLHTDDDLHVVYGQGTYTLSEATAVSIPANLPPEATSTSSLIAKIIIQKSATSFTTVIYPWTDNITSSGATLHNSLSGIQGGSSALSQFYHLTAANHTALTTSTLGDIWYSSATDTLAKLGIGSTGDVLTVTGGIPAWETPATTAYKTTVTTGDARWSTNLLSLTHGIDGSIPADELQYQFIGVTTGDKYEPDYDSAGSSTTVAAYDFTNCGKPTESIKASLISAGGSGTGSGTDTSAIHDNVAGEIVAITEKTTVVADDELIIEDSADSNNKKSIKTIVIGNLTGLQTINAQTGTAYTLALTDSKSADNGQPKTVTMTNGSANTVTIPTNASVAFPVGSVIIIVQNGAGTTTITGDTGVTVNGVSGGSGDMSGQYKAVYVQKLATDTWIVIGAIGTVS